MNIPGPSFELQVVTSPRLKFKQVYKERVKTNTHLSLGRSSAYIDFIMVSWMSGSETSHTSGKFLWRVQQIDFQKNIKKKQHELDTLDINGVQHNLFGFRLFRRASFLQTFEIRDRHLRQCATPKSCAGGFGCTGRPVSNDSDIGIRTIVVVLFSM